MKVKLILFSLLLTSCLHAATTPLQRAQELYVAIGCRADDGVAIIGSGFPVAAREVMSAGHVACEGEEAISLDLGKSWMTVEDTYTHAQYDVQIILLPRDTFTTWAAFRVPTLGEPTFNFGSSYGENGYASTGIIARVNSDTYAATNPPIGGMSGSAIIGEDGAVLGIVNWGFPDYRVGGATTQGYRGDTLDHLLKEFNRELWRGRSSKAPEGGEGER